LCVVRFGNQTLPVNGGGGVSVGPAVYDGLSAISMKEDWVQGAPLHLHTQLHTHFVPHTMATGNDRPRANDDCRGQSLTAAVV